jgi:hypothetical protein
MRTLITNQLQAVAMNEGKRWKKKLFSEQGRAVSLWQADRQLSRTYPVRGLQRRPAAPIFFFQAANDFDLSPSKTLSAASGGIENHHAKSNAL